MSQKLQQKFKKDPNSRDIWLLLTEALTYHPSFQPRILSNFSFRLLTSGSFAHFYLFASQRSQLSAVTGLPETSPREGNRACSIRSLLARETTVGCCLAFTEILYRGSQLESYKHLWAVMEEISIVQSPVLPVWWRAAGVSIQSIYYYVKYRLSVINVRNIKVLWCNINL